MPIRFAAAALLLMPLAALASPVPIPLAVSSYDMPNGAGVASGGSFNYWDAGYTGSGAVTTDGAPLAGGTGKLTDGVFATQPWSAVSNLAGTGEYVGWLGTVTPDPVLTFTFIVPTCPCSVLVDTLNIWMDNTLTGGVGAPVDILIDGVSYAYVPPAAGTVGPVQFSGLGLTGPVHTLQFVNDPLFQWVMVSEIQWFGTITGVPAPAAAAMFLVGLAGLAAVRRRG